MTNSWESSICIGAFLITGGVSDDFSTGPDNNLWPAEKDSW